MGHTNLEGVTLRLSGRRVSGAVRPFGTRADAYHGCSRAFWWSDDRWKRPMSVRWTEEGRNDGAPTVPESAPEMSILECRFCEFRALIGPAEPQSSFCPKTAMLELCPGSTFFSG